jgi:hypothetical protein
MSAAKILGATDFPKGFRFVGVGDEKSEEKSEHPHILGNSSFAVAW